MGKTGHRCAVWGCNAVQRTGSGVSFHGFPLDEEICQEWVDALNQPGFVVKEKSMVCDRHFVEDDWSTTTTKKRRIKFGAKPSLNLAPPDCPERLQMAQKMDRERMAFLRRGGDDGPLLLTVCGPSGQQLRTVPDATSIPQQQQQYVAQNSAVVSSQQQQQQQAAPVTTTYTFRVVQPEPQPVQAMSMPVLTSGNLPNQHHQQQQIVYQPRQTRSGGGKLPGWQMKLRSERTVASPTKATTGKGKRNVSMAAAQPTRASSRRAGGRRR